MSEKLDAERAALLGAPPYPNTVAEKGPLPDIAIQGWTPEEAEFRYFNRLQELLALRGDKSD